MSVQSDEEILDAHDDQGYATQQDIGELYPSRLDGRRPTYAVRETADQLRAAFADLTPVGLLLAGAAAVNRHEVDRVALLSLLCFDHPTCLTPLELPNGRLVASLHAHIATWKHRPGGFVDAETRASGRLTGGREPLRT